jgi:hypothetical protein
MISKVPVVRYLGFDQSGCQPQRSGCQSSQISDHGVTSGVNNSTYRLSEKNMTAGGLNRGYHMISIHLYPDDIVNYFQDGTLTV